MFGASGWGEGRSKNRILISRISSSWVLHETLTLSKTQIFSSSFSWSFCRRKHHHHHYQLSTIVIISRCRRRRLRLLLAILPESGQANPVLFHSEPVLLSERPISLPPCDLSALVTPLAVSEPSYPYCLRLFKTYRYTLPLLPALPDKHIIIWRSHRLSGRLNGSYSIRVIVSNLEDSSLLPLPIHSSSSSFNQFWFPVVHHPLIHHRRRCRQLPSLLVLGTNEPTLDSVQPSLRELR